MNESLSLEPIGVFRAAALKKYELPRQPHSSGQSGEVILAEGKNFEQALEGLESFDRVWLLFAFHQAKGWRPKVLPTRALQKIGLFATRSPYRPSSLGLSCVKLIEIKKRTLTIEGSDLIDSTPIFDIKPYIPYCDSFPDSKAGWVDDLAGREYQLSWSERALEQRGYLQATHGVVFADEAFSVLRFFLGPNHYNRVSHLYEDVYMLAYKSWRFVFSSNCFQQKIQILCIQSGYLPEELFRDTTTQSGDLIVHRDYSACVFASKEYALLC